MLKADQKIGSYRIINQMFNKTLMVQGEITSMNFN